MPPEYDYRPHPTQLERRAFNDRPVPGELFTRNPLAKQQAAEWAAKPEFGRNRLREVCHDAVVAMRRVEYNSHGWHDKYGHLYYLESDGDPADRAGPIEPLFFRAQHGQIVNVTVRNDLPRAVEETEFDPAFPPCPELPWEGECATHVHMVKFDPICADGASVGWNYMSGTRFGRKMVYRWWADQQFGTIFFHDHLFANYRQKHGLFGALLVEPAGSTFLHPIEPGREIITGVQALIRRHAQDTASPPWFREFCIGIGDFVPMWNRSGQALNPPARPGGHGDQGVMGLNYRNSPLRERPGNPATGSVRLFTATPTPHCSRPTPATRSGCDCCRDHTRSSTASKPTACGGNDFATESTRRSGTSRPSASPRRSRSSTERRCGPATICTNCPGSTICGSGAGASSAPSVVPTTVRMRSFPYSTPHRQRPQSPPHTGVRRFWVEARQTTLQYRRDLVDPFALVYRVTRTQGPTDPAPVPVTGAEPGPLVLWCREGEQVVVTVRNRFPEGTVIEPEPFAPEVPVERAARPVSSHVSMHADLVEYDISSSDGANIGNNPLQSVRPQAARTYTWRTYRPADSNEALGPVLLQDMADVRNHRHHGLIGALVILPANAKPYLVTAGQKTATAAAPERWHGARVTVRHTTNGAVSKVTEEMVVLLQDGLRLFHNGQIGFPLPDPPGEIAGEAEDEDQGQKGLNYRSEPRGPVF
jgi:FtsP/CotA-like multicopper oxidase with cupredoxin domain